METRSSGKRKRIDDKKDLLRSSLQKIDSEGITELLYHNEDGKEDGLTVDAVLDVLNERDEASKFIFTRFMSLCEGSASSTIAVLIGYLRQHDRLEKIVNEPAPDGATPLYISCERGHV